jgi:DNA-nicking Smr family endonuclease
MPPRARPLSEADRAAWEAVAGRITPLKGRPRPVPSAAVPPAPDPPPPAAVLPPRPFPKVAARATPRPVAVGDHPGGIDTGTWERFRGGKLPSVRKLDLHGMTAQRAFHALVSFLRTAHADRVRCVEVVTGRGSGETGGVIRREFPMWLNLPEIRPLVLAAAHPHAANPGSVRLLLRRVR